MTRPIPALAALTAVCFVAGVVVATATPGPLWAVDDVAYLALARTLAGEGAAPLGPQAPYGTLYPALLAPGWFFGLGSDAMVAYARTVNAACGALLLPTLYALVRRLTGEPPRRALAAALIGAALPALWLTASIVWTERLLALLTAAALLAVVEMSQRPSTGRAVAAAASAVALFAAHPRAGPAAVVVIAALWLPSEAAGPPGPGTGRQRRLKAARLTATALGAVGLVLVELGRRALATAAFASTGTYDVFFLAERRGIGRLDEMAQRAGGTLAYLVLATAALAVPGAIWLARKRGARHAVLAMTAACVATAGWFLTGAERADTWLHGRYVEVTAPVLVALGVVALGRLSRRACLTAVVCAPTAAGIYAAWAGPGDNWENYRSPPMMFGVEPAGAPFGAEVFEPGAAAAVALAVGLAMWLGLRSRAANWVPALFAVLAGIGVASGLASLDGHYEGRITGRIAATGVDLDEVGELHIDLASASAYMASGVAWEVGLDQTTVTATENTTHVLLGPDAEPPPGASAVITFGEGTLWLLG